MLWRRTSKGRVRERWATAAGTLRRRPPTPSQTRRTTGAGTAARAGGQRRLARRSLTGGASQGWLARRWTCAQSGRERAQHDMSHLHAARNMCGRAADRCGEQQKGAEGARARAPVEAVDAGLAVARHEERGGRAVGPLRRVAPVRAVRVAVAPAGKEPGRARTTQHSGRVSASVRALGSRPSARCETSDVPGSWALAPPRRPDRDANRSTRSPVEDCLVLHRARAALPGPGPGGQVHRAAHVKLVALPVRVVQPAADGHARQPRQRARSCSAAIGVHPCFLVGHGVTAHGARSTAWLPHTLMSAPPPNHFSPGAHEADQGAHALLERKEDVHHPAWRQQEQPS